MQNLKLSDSIFSHLFAKGMLCFVIELQHRVGDAFSWADIYGLRLGMTMHKPE